MRFMDNSEEPKDKSIEPSGLEKFLLSPEIQKGLSEIPDLIRANIEAKNTLLKAQMEAQTSTTQGATKWILLWSAILVLIIIAPVSVLTWSGKISSDACAFLFGAIVGAAFTFLRTFFPRSS